MAIDLRPAGCRPTGKPPQSTGDIGKLASDVSDDRSSPAIRNGSPALRSMVDGSDVITAAADPEGVNRCAVPMTVPTLSDVMRPESAFPGEYRAGPGEKQPARLAAWAFDRYRGVNPGRSDMCLLRVGFHPAAGI
mmetsp:Transcript_551/g.1677  ORF Transcript_551/g.1677 Transcript_551/m.1677 type:complete len:135 (-) Transcript_551:960-1364(-)